MKIESYRDLVVWQKGVRLAVECHRLAKALPKSEEFRLASQLIRAAASIPANIAEGHARGTRKDYANFVNIARGSLAETETFLILVVEIGLLKAEDTKAAFGLCDEVGRMLTALVARLREPPP